MSFETIRYATNSFSWHAKYNKSVEPMSDEQLVAQAAEAGAEGIEIDPDRVTVDMLARYAIVLSGTSVGGVVFSDWNDEKRDEIVATAAATAALGGQYLFFTASLPGGWGKWDSITDDLLKLGAERMDDLAQRVHAEGVNFVLHNHADSPRGLAVELALVQEHTNPDYVGMLLDIGWAYTAGADPVSLIHELGPRLGGFHLRNQVGRVPAASLIDGDIDIAAVATAMKGISYRGWVTLELYHPEDTKVTKPMLDYQKESLAYMRQLLG